MSKGAKYRALYVFVSFCLSEINLKSFATVEEIE